MFSRRGASLLARFLPNRGSPLPGTSSSRPAMKTRLCLASLHSGPPALSAQQARFDELMVEEARRRPILVGSGGGRKRRSVTSYSKQPRSPSVVSLALAESLDLYALAADPAINQIYSATFIDEEFDDALHLVKRIEYQIDPGSLSEIFVFADGVIVFWNVEMGTRAQLLRDLERHAVGVYESVVAHAELDSIPFSLTGEGRSTIRRDCFVLDATKHGEARHLWHDSVLERFAFSHAFAASVKIGVWESLLNSEAEPLSNSTKELARGRIPWDRKEALRRAGEFADLRHSINLNCTLLNRDIYWERPHLENYYDMTSRHLTVERRLKLLNNRLDYCEGLVKMVDNVLALRHASTLEWMIIILIVIEVIFDTLHYLKSGEPQQVVIVQPPPPLAVEDSPSQSTSQNN